VQHRAFAVFGQYGRLRSILAVFFFRAVFGHFWPFWSAAAVLGHPFFWSFLAVLVFTVGFGHFWPFWSLAAFLVNFGRFLGPFFGHFSAFYFGPLVL